MRPSIQHSMSRPGYQQTISFSAMTTTLAPARMRTMSVLRQGSSTGALQQTMRWPSSRCQHLLLQCRLHSGRTPLPRHPCRLLPCSSPLIDKCSDQSSCQPRVLVHAVHGSERCIQHSCRLRRPSTVSPCWTCLSARRPWHQWMESNHGTGLTGQVRRKRLQLPSHRQALRVCFPVLKQPQICIPVCLTSMTLFTSEGPVVVLEAM